MENFIFCAMLDYHMTWLQRDLFCQVSSTTKSNLAPKNQNFVFKFSPTFLTIILQKSSTVELNILLDFTIIKSIVLHFTYTRFFKRGHETGG